MNEPSKSVYEAARKALYDLAECIECSEAIVESVARAIDDAARRERERCVALTYEAEGDRLRDLMSEGAVPAIDRVHGGRR